ncbi:hypothetical protein CRG98_036269 [Punica granatum]|uniref:Retrotransposon gag domain-containing protein n=1 Tax=Punica granatum TaxID=22663 RepID=A0A2I0IH53_PUNGR|nr:hypothetical protein CRG98_036269 [Punica granatum]
MEETIRALQAGTSHLDYGDFNWNLFPGMRLPSKIKIPDFKRYDGTKDPRHHLRHYQSKMLQYWNYEEFIIQTFQDSLMAPALDWFMTLKAEDILTWADLSQKFLDQYRFCAETPPTLLELSTMEMKENRVFEAYATEWRGKAAKHIPPISEIQQVQLFHSTLKGHTTDNCWKLREKIQEMIDAKRISFSEVKPPNVRANPLPDHRVYQGPELVDKGKTSAVALGYNLRAASTLTKKVSEEEAEAFMKVIKTSKYKVVEQMAKSPAYISLLALLLSFEPHRDALLKVLTVAQVPKEIAPERIEETGQGHLRALHIVCKCNNHVVGRVMINNGSALNVCPVSTLKQMNVDMSRIRASKTTVRAFDGSRRDILEIPNAFSLLLGRPWIHAASAVPSSLHQKLKFFVEGKLITVNGEEDYAIYKETAVPYVSIGEDQNLPFHSFDTIAAIRDYGEVGLSRADRMIGKVLLRSDNIPGTGLGAHA